MGSLLRWLVLLIVLVAPAFLTWNWWQGLTMEQKITNITRIQRHVPPSLKFGPFGSGSGQVTQKKMTTPVLPAVTPVPVRPAVASDTGRHLAVGSDSSPTTSGKENGLRLAAAAVAAPQTEGGSRPHPTISRSLATVSTGTGAVSMMNAPMTGGKENSLRPELEFRPQTDRDPLLTVQEMYYLRLQGQPVIHEKSVPIHRSCDSGIRLMGTVETAGSIRVIVNDKIVKRGETVLGAKVLKIVSNPTSVSVTFQCKEKGKIKTFTKRIKQ